VGPEKVKGEGARQHVCAARVLQEEMEVQQPQRKRDIDEGQGRIVAVVRRLEEAGTIVLSGGEGEGEEEAVL
jgi:flagellar motor switch protein FliG